MQWVKQHDNLRKFPNAASINTSVRLDKISAGPVITLVLTALVGPIWSMSDRKIQILKISK